MKLSVVIPVYNGQDFIQKSYDSILHQGISDFEIMYVDNNSEDDSVQEIERLVALDSRVTLLFQPKQGAAAARNMGIAHANGDYVYVFDVDDEIYEGALQRMIQVLDTYPNVSAVFGKMVKSSQGIAATPKPTDESHEVILKAAPYWGLYWFANLKHVVGPPAFLYRRKVFESIGLYNEAIFQGEDNALDIKLGMTSNIAFLDTYVYLYYKHASSTIETAKRKMPRAFMIWPRLVKEHLPFYMAHPVPETFKRLLFTQLYQSMGRQLVYTKTYSDRKGLRRDLLQDLGVVSLPMAIQLYLLILVALPFEVFRKVYGYYVVPFVVNHQISKL